MHRSIWRTKKIFINNKTTTILKESELKNNCNNNIVKNCNLVHTFFKLSHHSMLNNHQKIMKEQQPNSNQQQRQIHHPEVAAMRISYDSGELTEETIKKDPFDQFETWFQEAKKTLLPPEHEVNAMCLSTCDPKTLRPSSRMVLLKDYDRENGFVFYTNYHSRKAQELDANPFASLNFYWHHGTCSRCVRVEGKIERISEEESTAYFLSRPVGSRIGAWTSEFQSGLIPGGRQELEEREQLVAEKFKSSDVPNIKNTANDNEKQKNGQVVVDVPKPPFWGGYRVIPDVFEFWQGRPSRLHDRLVFKKLDDNQPEWKLMRLSP